MVSVDFENLHDTRDVLWPNRWCKNIIRCPEDELGAKMLVSTETKIIEVLLKLGDIV